MYARHAWGLVIKRGSIVGPPLVFPRSGCPFSTHLVLRCEPYACPSLPPVYSESRLLSFLFRLCFSSTFASHTAALLRITSTRSLLSFRWLLGCVVKTLTCGCHGNVQPAQQFCAWLTSLKSQWTRCFRWNQDSWEKYVYMFFVYS